jgi:hypothetical protein
MLRYHLTRAAGNKKTGRMAVTTSTWENCPLACPFRNGGGCYAEAGYHTKLMTDRITAGLPVVWNSAKAPQTIAQHVAAIAALDAGTLLRLNAAGDLPGDRTKLKPAQVLRLAAASGAGNKIAWTYTHYPLTGANLATIRASIDAGLTVNVSGNSIADGARKFKRHKLPTTAVAPADFHGSKTVDGVRFAQCPATVPETSITCATCGNGSPICARADRTYVVAFPAHGTAKRKATEVATRSTKRARAA